MKVNKHIWDYLSRALISADDYQPSEDELIRRYTLWTYLIDCGFSDSKIFKHVLPLNDWTKKEYKKMIFCAPKQIYSYKEYESLPRYYVLEVCTEKKTFKLRDVQKVDKSLSFKDYKEVPKNKLKGFCENFYLISPGGSIISPLSLVYKDILTATNVEKYLTNLMEGFI